MNECDVIVIGAGAAGVAAARKLQASKRSVVVLEARDRVSGRAWTWKDPSGLPLDLGCGWLHSAPENEWAALAPPLGLTIDKTTPPWQREQDHANFPLAEQRQFRAAMARFYDRLEDEAEIDPDRPASTLLEPGNRWNGLLDAISTYINGVTLSDVSVRDLARYHDTEVNWRVTEGYGALIEAYAAPLDVRLGSLVTQIDHSGARIRVVTSRGELSTRAVIVTVPTDVLARETIRFHPALPDKLAVAAALPLGLADKLFLRVDKPEVLPIEGRLFGAIDRADTGSYHLRPFGRPMIEGYFGGPLARALEDEGATGFANYAIEQIVAILGNDIRKHLSLITTSSWARDPYALGSYSHALVGHADDRAILAAPVDGRLLFAGEACSRHDFSTAHGAYRTGVDAAEGVMRALRQD